MANHKSAVKRIRSDETKKLRNRYQHKTTRTVLKKFFDLEKKKDAQKQISAIESMVDKLAKKNIIHQNKASNIKSRLTKHLSSLKK